MPLHHVALLQDCDVKPHITSDDGQSQDHRQMESMPHNTLDLPDMFENEADNEGLDKIGITGVDKVKCRGPGHIRACDFCFFVDERFGRH